MQISSRFTLAIHILTCIETFKDEYKVTSDFLAGSTNVNAVIVRKILLQLKAAGLVQVVRGTGGTSIIKPLEEISFLDIFSAVECVENGELFTKIPIPLVLSAEIFMLFWMINCSVFNRRWKMNWRPSL